MPHPLVLQLRFARSEFERAFKGTAREDAVKRLGPMNCISWIVGHLAWQEQRYWLTRGQELVIFPELNKNFAYGAPACTPELADTRKMWRQITAQADPWLDQLNSEMLAVPLLNNGQPSNKSFGNLLLRTTYHYWYHTGEISSIRQMLGHQNLPQYVGNIDRHAPYVREDNN